MIWFSLIFFNLIDLDFIYVYFKILIVSVNFILNTTASTVNYFII